MFQAVQTILLEGHWEGLVCEIGLGALWIINPMFRQRADDLFKRYKDSSRGV